MEKNVTEKNPILQNPRKEKRLMIWDCIWFGHYMQSNASGEMEPIKWRVLAVNGKDVFLVADKNLDLMPYNMTADAVSWETCTLRSWLNGYGKTNNLCGNDYSGKGFINLAFTEEEQKAILVTELVNNGNPKAKISGGNNTKDKVFILSYEDVTNDTYGFAANDGKYDEARGPKHTAFVAAGGSNQEKPYINADGKLNWWLRNPGEYRQYAMYNNSIGYVTKSGLSVDRCGWAVRPALHLDIEQVDCWTYAGTVTNKDLEYIAIAKGRTTYAIGEKLDCKDMTVTAYYSNDSEKLVKKYETNIKDIDMTVEGMKELVVSYTERGISQTTSVKIVVQKMEQSFLQVGEKAGALHNPQTDWKGIVTWDCIYFGHYPQSDITGETKEPIRWRILYMDGNDAFLIADRCLEIKNYNETMEEVTWETCTVRSWLNGYGSDVNACRIDYRQDNFLKRAFSEEEQKAILPTLVLNTGNFEFHVPDGNDTKDKIFCLSYEEAASALFGFDTDADEVDDYATKRFHTAYTAHQKNLAEDEDTCHEGGKAAWLLRSPGQDLTHAMTVDMGGMRHRSGSTFERLSKYVVGVCPALHLNLAHAEVWSYAGTVSSDQNEAPGTIKGNAEFMARIAQKRISKAMLNKEYD